MIISLKRFELFPSSLGFFSKILYFLKDNVVIQANPGLSV